MDKKLQQCYEAFRKFTDFVPEIAVILGSGLGANAENMDIVTTIDYKELPGFPVSTVSGHKGRFVLGYVNDVPVVMMQGRVHYYEGYSITDVVLPVRLMKMMGAKVLFLTNAAGGLNTSFKPGDFMIINDHISNFVPSCLIGPNLEEFGPRFPDMSEIYDKDLINIIENTAKSLDIPVRQGVYVQTTGPNFESPAEVRMFKLLGGDAVGMSTACEAMAANHAGMKICGISCISNLACGLSDNPLCHEEVIATGKEVAPLFTKLVFTAIENIHASLS